MVQLLTERLLQKFTGRIASASQVDIAVAWVTPSEALERLRKLALRPGIRIRVAVGLSGNGTHPEALRSLQKFAELRITPLCLSRSFVTRSLLQSAFKLAVTSR
jgi:HKD family nuclease